MNLTDRLIAFISTIQHFLKAIVNLLVMHVLPNEHSLNMALIETASHGFYQEIEIFREHQIISPSTRSTIDLIRNISSKLRSSIMATTTLS